VTGRPIDWRAVLAELLGTAFLLAAVVGSGIMGERLADGSVGLTLLANSIATGGALYALIHLFGPISGAHFNPAVTAAMVAARQLPRAAAAFYVSAQLIGAVIGVWTAHLMFDLPILQASTHARTGLGQWTGEFVATFGLIAVIEGGRRRAPGALPAMVALYILAAYWFTSSTSFANPAVTIARALSDTFAGIAPADVAGFIAAQAAGAAAAVYVMRWLSGERSTAGVETTQTSAETTAARYAPADRSSAR
jgi:glycerol uptake facilitator-like aquaporin